MFSGGQVVTGRRQNGSVWKAELPEVKTGRWYFCQRRVNRQHRSRA